MNTRRFLAITPIMVSSSIVMASFFFTTTSSAQEKQLTPEKQVSENIGSSEAVVAPAPDFQWRQGNKIEHLGSLRGKPVLLLVTDSPRNRSFRHQLQGLKSHYERLASHGLVCAVAFTQEEGAVPSNIPFITVSDGAATALAYGLPASFGLALLGADGNVDCLSSHPLSGQRINDLMNASFTVQSALRRP